MMRSTKELRHVYRDFLLEANQSDSDIVVLEADFIHLVLLLHEEYLINYLFLLDTHNWMPL
ncbi:transketolase c-terminal section [Streptococcus pneumoniae]|nr:transketolase c-terminal section [Streptococcus pneumoniae]